jgi:hypothetical protein
MCRWMAYSGDPILAEELLFKPQHSIIDQSLHPGSASPRQMATDSGPAGTAKALNDLATPKPCSFLAPTFGFTDDPFEAVSGAIGFVEKLARMTELSTRSRGPPCHQQRRVHLGHPLLQRRARADHFVDQGCNIASAA